MSNSPHANERLPALARVGGHPVVVVDKMSGDVAAVRAAARELAPFPAAFNFYPGVRRVVNESDGVAWSYVSQLVTNAASYIGGAFDCDGFDLIEASFSIVTTPPKSLTPPQRAPHFDGTDPNLIAMVHFLGDVPESGTAFFRHRATGVDWISEGNLTTYVAAAKNESTNSFGYIQGTNDCYEELARFEAIADRLLIYPGSLLHSGIIPPGMPLSADPMAGRLTANFFLRLTH